MIATVANKTRLCRLVFLIMAISYFGGCSSDYAPLEKSVAIKDHLFSIEEKSPIGTFVGQIEVEPNAEYQLRCQIVHGEFSKYFGIDTLLGTLYLKDSIILEHETTSIFTLEVMVVYGREEMDYAAFSNCSIKVISMPEPFSIDLKPIPGFYQEALIDSLNPDDNFNEPTVLLASAWTSNMERTIIRSLFQFDMTSIPANTQLTGATLSLYNPNNGDLNYDHSSFSGSNAFYISRITSEWNKSTVTWNSQPSYSKIDQVELPFSQANNQNYTNIDVLQIVQQMVNNPEANFGFAIQLVNENYYRRICFASMNYPDERLRPSLTISYLK